jgi:hypothetical protein
MDPGKHIILSRPAWFFLLFLMIVLLSNSLYRHYNKISARNFVMGSDMEGYYQYLPHLFLMNKEEMKQMRWAKPYGDDIRLNVFTCGVAIMQLPFFLIAHEVSKFLEMESNGYNPVYFMSVLFAAIFYVYTGLYYLFKLLSRLFTRRTAFLTAILVFLATNLFYYTVMGPGLSHAYSFCLIAMYIYYVPGFYKNPGIRSTLKMILPLALAVLIRPTTIVAGFYFLLYDVVSFRAFGQRLLFLFRRWYLLLLMLIAGFIVFIPQMAYWHLVTGKWFVYSYQSEGFSNALSPRIFTVLFGARNGWYLYTPLMLLATGGLFYLVYRCRYSAPAILLIMILIVYINSSWWLPTFSASAGYRTLIEYIPFMAIPLAFIVERTYTNKKRTSWILTTVLILFIIYNILFSYKYETNLWWNTGWQWSNFQRLLQF